MTDQLRELIERLEKVTGPDRELDAAIHERAVGLRMYDSIYERGGDLCLRYYADSTGPSYRRLPRYTESMDDAVTLVPEGLAWTLGQNVHHRYWQARINNLDDDGRPQSIGYSGLKGNRTAPLALCIAALKARVHLRDASKQKVDSPAVANEGNP